MQYIAGTVMNQVFDRKIQEEIQASRKRFEDRRHAAINLAEYIKMHGHEALAVGHWIKAKSAGDTEYTSLWPEWSIVREWLGY